MFLKRQAETLEDLLGSVIYQKPELSKNKIEHEFWSSFLEAYPGPCQTSKMRSFAEKVRGLAVHYFSKAILHV